MNRKQRRAIWAGVDNISTPTQPPKAVSQYMAAIGRKGGETKGASKRRTTAHYKAAAAARWAKHRSR